MNKYKLLAAIFVLLPVLFTTVHAQDDALSYVLDKKWKLFEDVLCNKNDGNYIQYTQTKDPRGKVTVINGDKFETSNHAVFNFKRIDNSSFSYYMEMYAKDNSLIPDGKLVRRTEQRITLLDQKNIQVNQATITYNVFERDYDNLNQVTTHSLCRGAQLSQQVSLTVNTTPANAKIRILNIKPKYKPGMEVQAGKYHIEVSANGYQTYKEWHEINSNNGVVIVTLEKANEITRDTIIQHVIDPCIWDLVVVLENRHGKHETAAQRARAFNILKTAFEKSEMFEYFISETQDALLKGDLSEYPLKYGYSVSAMACTNALDTMSSK